jgi:SAM-dependent methyltransferase
VKTVKSHESYSDETIEDPPARLFQRQWSTYCKMIDNNYLFHREAYNRLHKMLVDEFPAPFRFLDIACGDASASVAALQGTQVARYQGIDLSEAALRIAAKNLAGLKCKVDLHEVDLAEALRHWDEHVDVAWIGLSLHHFRAPEKLDLMLEVHRILGKNGMLLFYENASPDCEVRKDWLRRWDQQRPHWTAFTPEEWDTVALHVHENDFPETTSTWHQLGRAAGFDQVMELFVAPTNLFRLYCFRSDY